MTRDELCNLTNVSADTRYFPTEAANRGFSVPDKALRLLLQMVCTSGVTVTIEGTLDDKDKDGKDRTESWVDITKLCKSANTDASGAASFVDKTDLVLIPPTLGLARCRFKVVTADASNTCRLVLGVGQ
jgi:hypothetical protein